MSELDPLREVMKEGPSSSTRASQRSELLEPKSREVWKAALAIALILISVTVLLINRRDPTPLISAGTWLTASTRFEEGTVITVSNGSALHLDAYDAQHAELTLTHGDFDATVTKNTGRTWKAHAGPWIVRVVGTQFHVHFEPDQEIEVRVTEGIVEVTGPDDQQLIHRGESFRRVLTRVAAPIPEVTKPIDPPRVVVSKPKSVPVPEVVPPAVEEAPDWRSLLRQGKRSDALELIRSLNFTELTDEDLLRLADAARVERDDALARELLAKLTSRGGPSAAEASFLLGRLCADLHELKEARSAFEGSLALAPSGAFSEQARGRLLEVLLETEDLPAARTHAREYLNRHPSGAWSKLAKRLVEQQAP